MNRLYVVESTPTLTGTMADHRLPFASGEIKTLAREIARQLANKSGALGDVSAAAVRWIGLVVKDLQRHRGQSIVIAGESQPPEVHALAHWLNNQLGNVGQTVFYTEPAAVQSAQQLQSLRELTQEMKAGAVQTLFILGGNPVYSAPADLEFAQALNQVKRGIYLGLERDETAAFCQWHIPQAHYLESWGDARSYDGTVSLLQPLIAPLYDGKTAHELLGALDTRRTPIRSDYEIVRDFWREQGRWPDFESGWRRALHDGLIANTALPEKQVTLNADSIQQLAATGSVTPPGELEVIFRPDPSVWDGRFANNGWLQECAKPISKLTWDNAVLVSAALAQRLKWNSEDVVELKFEGRTVRCAVWITPGQAENTITLPLGYGRERVGRVGTGAGFNAYRLRTSDSLWRATGVEISKTEARHSLAATQTHHQLEGPVRQIYRDGTLRGFQANADFIKSTVEEPPPGKTLYNPKEYSYDGYKWGMSIDLNTCIGCNACLVACNAENNIPVVGKEQVRMNREMYWIRIDTYFKGSIDNPEFNHQPVPCMHCEHAPCELVCPVAATVHSGDGLNQMVYNRCVGTRFCSNNCPYKVRRFNFLWYADYKTPSLKPMYNPDVTVRWRGVMEKCTYCIQRISRARITAEKENRAIREGEVVTACQQACPAQAIIFGDLNTKGSAVARLKEHPLDFPMLGELNTRPRTTYLAKLRNENPQTESDRRM
ncbi:MAG: 4Fe-4S dicluster domain-containing protein [Verrucomicrobiota bacterium]